MWNEAWQWNSDLENKMVLEILSPVIHHFSEQRFNTWFDSFFTTSLYDIPEILQLIS